MDLQVCMHVMWMDVLGTTHYKHNNDENKRRTKPPVVTQHMVPPKHPKPTLTNLHDKKLSNDFFHLLGWWFGGWVGGTYPQLKCFLTVN